MKKIILVALLLSACSNNPDKSSYCYIERGFYGTFALKSKQYGTFDPIIGNFHTIPEALEAAKQLNCPMKDYREGK